jgi:glycosyltransferase involved in cell wall biosynthesis
VGSGVPIPSDLERLPRPRVGFVGALDDYKVDADLLREVAQLQPDWQFVLIGPAGVAGASPRVTALAALGNVHMLGSRPHAELPAYLRGMDACIIPYHLNRYTESCLPLKFFEFLGAGKAIISTPLPELLPYASVARFAATAEAFASEIAAALREDDTALREARLEVARENTWEAKAARMERIVEELGV